MGSHSHVYVCAFFDPSSILRQHATRSQAPALVDSAGTSSPGVAAAEGDDDASSFGPVSPPLTTASGKVSMALSTTGSSFAKGGVYSSALPDAAKSRTSSSE